MATPARSTTAQVGDGEPRNSEAGEWCFHASPVPKGPRRAERKRSKPAVGAARAPRCAPAPTARQPHVQHCAALCRLHTSVPSPAGTGAHKGLLPSAFQMVFSKGNEARGLSADNAARWGRTVEVSHTPNRTAESSLVPISAGASLGKETQPCEQREPAVVGTHYKFKIGSVNNEHPKVTRCLCIVG